jgi:hypothetical protein
MVLLIVGSLHLDVRGFRPDLFGWFRRHDA